MDVQRCDVMVHWVYYISLYVLLYSCTTMVGMFAGADCVLCMFYVLLVGVALVVCMCENMFFICGHI